MKRGEALRLLTVYPAQVGRWCGFSRLRDGLHSLWIREMIAGEEDLTILAHRGSYKTTCLSMAIAILCVIRPNESILLLRKTDEDAAEVVRQVKQILESEAMRMLSASVYGSPVKIIRSTVLSLRCDCYGANRGCDQLTAGGIGGTLTGHHAERIFTDDIVTQRDRVSPAEREKTREIYRELQNVRIPGGRIVNIGTPWHPQDAVSLMPNQRKWDWRKTGLLTAAQAEKLRKELPPDLFAANYELRHVPSADALFPAAHAFVNDPLLIRDGIAHVDAAYGGSDRTALTCAAVRDGRIILYGRIWPGHVRDHMAEIAEITRETGCAPLYVETNGDRGYLAGEFRRLGLCVRAYRENMNKYMKISAVLGKWWPRIDILEGTDDAYLEEILDYSDRALHDDAPDSAACAVRELERRMRSAEGEWVSPLRIAYPQTEREKGLFF